MVLASISHDVRFLIVDEADRLLNQSYHDWVDKVPSFLTHPTRSQIEQTMAGGRNLKIFQQ
jgi:superfamily II DNA/RNA helicase